MRIISLSPSNTEILAALGVMENVIAVTHLCDYPATVKQKPRIGTWITTDSERLKRMKPDFIFTSYFLPPPLKIWRGPGKIVHVKPTTLEEVYESIRIIGGVAGKKKKAGEVIVKMKTQFETIKKQKVKKRPRVYMEEWHSPPFASGNWVPELVEIAGGEEVLGKRGEPSCEYDFGTLLKEDPDIIICHWCGAGHREDVKRVKERPGWEKLRAVQSNRIFFIDDSLLNRPGPRLIEGAEALQALFFRKVTT